MLRPSPVFRTLLALVSLLFAWVVLVLGPPNVPGVLILAILVLSALYDDRWTVDGEKGTLTHHHGLLWPGRKSTWALAKVSSVDLKVFTRGSQGPDSKKGLFSRTYISLVLETADGEVLKVETHRHQDGDDLEQFSHMLEDLCKVRSSRTQE